jgi:uncharacterized membrane protein YczE
VTTAPEISTAPAASRWRASPGRLAQLLLGLCAFGTGEALVVASELGNSPWTVLAEGVQVQTGIAIGVATVAISFAILLAWLPLGQRPGLGTIANAIVIGVAIDVALAVVGHPQGLLTRWLMVVGGIALVALGSGLYLTTFLGPGPRDGLMTGLHRRTGVQIGAIRTGIEVTALLAGWALGGTLGLGTLAFAVAIGPAVAAMLRLLARGPLTEL